MAYFFAIAGLVWLASGLLAYIAALLGEIQMRYFEYHNRCPFDLSDILPIIALLPLAIPGGLITVSVALDCFHPEKAQVLLINLWKLAKKKHIPYYSALALPVLSLLLLWVVN